MFRPWNGKWDGFPDDIDRAVYGTPVVSCKGKRARFLVVPMVDDVYQFSDQYAICSFGVSLERDKYKPDIRAPTTFGDLGHHRLRNYSSIRREPRDAGELLGISGQISLLSVYLGRPLLVVQRNYFNGPRSGRNHRLGIRTTAARSLYALACRRFSI